MEQNNHLSIDNVFLTTLREQVLQNLDNEQFSVEQLSKQMSVSRSQLHRKLKILRSQSVTEYIREVRLQEAMKMLKDETGTVAEIAWKVGFTSPSYFNKCFQKYYGFPPGEVKNRKQAGILDAPAKTGEQKLEVLQSTGKKQTLNKLILVAVIIIAGSLMAWFLIFNNRTANLEKSIAVLPFNNLSTEVENQYFADGIVEDLLSRLSLLKEIKVISRTSSDKYRARGIQSLPQIASELGVSYIVEGSVQKEGSKARISVQLIDARNDNHIWAKNFDRDLEDIFEVQSEIATQIASEVNRMLSAEQAKKVQKSQTESFKAYELYHLGRYYWNKRTDEGYHKSIELYEQAIAEDSNYGLAYAGLADTYNLMAIQGWIDKKQGRDKAVELALKALSLNENLAEAWTVLGSIYDYVDWKWEEAENAFQRAMEINPNYATAHHYYSEHLSILGKHEEARRQINKAKELDPLSFVIRYVSTKLYFHRGQFKEARAENQKMKTFNPGHNWTFEFELRLNKELGLDENAYKTVLNYFTKNYGTPAADIEGAYKSGGLDGVIRWMISDYLKYINPEALSPYHVANLYAIIGEKEKAMEWLQKSYGEREISPEFSFNYYFNRHLGNHPAFKKILQQMGLPLNNP